MIVSIKELEKIRKENINKNIVLAIGSFDLFHWEHLRYLNDAKKLGDILVVIVKDDKSIKQKGENRPIICEQQRIEIIDNLKCVDYCILANAKLDKNIYEQIIKQYNINLDETNKNWLLNFYEIIEKLKPDILYHENTLQLNDARKLISNIFNIKLIERERTEIVSTSKIINKIKGEF